MGKFLFGVLVGLILLPLAGYLYLSFGYAPVATAAAPFPMERKITSMALHARIAHEAPKEPGVPATEENFLAGAKLYREYCAVCHGMPGQPPTPTAKGEFPAPPQLFHGKGVTDDTPGETYWKVANGIRLTGMPAYGGSLSTTQIWQVSQLLANADKLPQSVRDFLATPPPAR